MAKNEPNAIVKPDEMNERQAADWKALFEAWLRDEFRPALRALDYRQDCVQCGDIYFVSRLWVDGEGHVERWEVVREEIDCRGKSPSDDEHLRKVVTDTYAKLQFGPSLRNTLVEARMGEVTRC